MQPTKLQNPPKTPKKAPKLVPPPPPHLVSTHPKQRNFKGSPPPRSPPPKSQCQPQFPPPTPIPPPHPQAFAACPRAKVRGGPLCLLSPPSCLIDGGGSMGANKTDWMMRGGGCVVFEEPTGKTKGKSGGCLGEGGDEGGGRRSGVGGRKWGRER